MIKISIIVPVYNVEKTVGRCVESIIAQTFKNIEILLIDDGSIDGSGTICDKYALKDARVKVIHKKNGGVGSARNVGLDNAIGKYVMFCDSDDYVEPTWCEKMYNSIEESDGFFSFCGYNSVRASGEIKNKKCMKSETSVSKKIIELYFTELLYSVWNKIFALAEIKANNIRFDEALCKAEDSIFVLQYLQIKVDNIGCVSECLYNYVFDIPTSLTKKTTLETWIVSCRFFREINKTMNLYDISFSEYSEIYYSNLIIAILQSLNALFDCNIERRELLARGREILNSDECKDAFRNGNIVNVHPIYKIVLQMRCFSLVYLFHRIVRLKYNFLNW